MTTLYRRIHDAAELGDPNVTKVVIDRGGFAMYFSRAPIPHLREPRGGWHRFDEAVLGAHEADLPGTCGRSVARGRREVDPCAG